MAGRNDTQQEREGYQGAFFDEAVRGYEDLDDYELSHDAVSRIDDAAADMGLFPDRFEGQRILDCGCGTGVVSVYLAEKGGQVQAIDLSEESLRLTRKRARKHGLEHAIETRLMSAEELSYPDESFDMVCGRFVLHHLDLARASRELYRVLKPGGKGIYFENSANNWLLMASRKYLTGRFGIPRVSDEVEHPLRRSDVATIREVFGEHCTTRYPLFVCFQLFDNLVFRRRFGLLTRAAGWLDRTTYRVAPFLRQYSYFQYVLLEKPNGPGT